MAEITPLHTVATPIGSIESRDHKEQVLKGLFGFALVLVLVIIIVMADVATYKYKGNSGLPAIIILSIFAVFLTIYSIFGIVKHARSYYRDYQEMQIM